MIDLLNPKAYIWIDAILIKETAKAILIEFDGQEIWLPKACITKIKRNKLRHCERPALRSLGEGGSEAISIKISEYHWTKKI